VIKGRGTLKPGDVVYFVNKCMRCGKVISGSPRRGAKVVQWGICPECIVDEPRREPR
jgi:hypothetical protein